MCNMGALIHVPIIILSWGLLIIVIVKQPRESILMIKTPFMAWEWGLETCQFRFLSGLGFDFIS